MTIHIDIFTHTCAACEISLKRTDRITALYKNNGLVSFAAQVELGIAGGSARNYWAHLYCSNPSLTGYPLQPTIHNCIECRNALERQDLIVPVFQVLNPKSINPQDVTDFGVELSDRIYFVHLNCRNTKLKQVFAG
jgi:hypothetical protein